MKRKSEQTVAEANRTIRTEVTVGVSDLRTHLSKYLRHVRSGRILVITRRGKKIARIYPENLSLEERLWAMVDAGLASWSGKKLKPMKPVAKVKEGHSVADLLIADRR